MLARFTASGLAADALTFVVFAVLIGIIAVSASGLFALLIVRALGLRYRGQERPTVAAPDLLGSMAHGDELHLCEICNEPFVFTRQPRRDQPGKPIRLCSKHMIEDGELDRIASPRQ